MSSYTVRGGAHVGAIDQRNPEVTSTQCSPIAVESCTIYKSGGLIFEPDAGVAGLINMKLSSGDSGLTIRQGAGDAVATINVQDGASGTTRTVDLGYNATYGTYMQMRVPNFILHVNAGDPDGSIQGAAGSLLWDSTNNKLSVCTGGTTWIQTAALT